MWLYPHIPTVYGFSIYTASYVAKIEKKGYILLNQRIIIYIFITTVSFKRCGIMGFSSLDSLNQDSAVKTVSKLGQNFLMLL
jgi:hypothetical protein